MKEIQSRLEQLAGKELRATLWPKTSQDVPDTKELKLAILAPEYSKQSGTSGAFVDELLKKCGTTFRTYQNTLLVLAPDGGEFASARQQIKRLLALRAISDDKTLKRQLSDENKKTLESKIKNLEGGIPFSLLSVYRHLAKPGEKGVEWFDLGLPTVGERGSLAKRVLEYLKSQEVLLERISPSNLLRKTLREDEQEKPISEISEAFLRYPQLPMVQNLAVIEQAISQGMRDGMFAVKIGDKVYFKVAPPAEIRSANAQLIRKELVQQAPSVAEPLPQVREAVPAAPSEPGVKTPTYAAPPTKTGVRHLMLRVKVPWDKFSDLVRGVIVPLHYEAELEVEVLVQARSKSGGIKPETLESKVKETLSQIGAEVMEEIYE